MVTNKAHFQHRETSEKHHAKVGMLSKSAKDGHQRTPICPQTSLSPTTPTAETDGVLCTVAEYLYMLRYVSHLNNVPGEMILLWQHDGHTVQFSSQNTQDYQGIPCRVLFVVDPRPP